MKFFFTLIASLCFIASSSASLKAADEKEIPFKTSLQFKRGWATCTDPNNKKWEKPNCGSSKRFQILCEQNDIDDLKYEDIFLLDSISDSELNLFSKFTDIQSLRLDCANLQPNQYSFLKVLPLSLKIFRLHDRFSNEICPNISHLTNLTDLGLNLYMSHGKKNHFLGFGENFTLTDNGLSHLSNLTNLRFLRLKNTGILGHGLQYLNCSHTLENLDLYDNPFKTFLYLGNFYNLKKLNLTNVDVPTSDEVGYICSRLSNLEVLIWGSISQKRDTDRKVKFLPECLQHFSNLTNLKEIDLSSAEVTNEGMLHLSALTNLEKIILFNTGSLQAAGGGITTAALYYLISLPHLKFVDLKEVTSLCEDGLHVCIKKFFTSLPEGLTLDLRKLTLDLRNTNLSSADNYISDNFTILISNNISLF